MTDNTKTPNRLNRSKSPPGYVTDGWSERTQRSKALMWLHHEEHSDPPGIEWICESLAKYIWYLNLGDLSKLEARAAAWTWYWRLVAVSTAVDAAVLKSVADNWIVGEDDDDSIPESTWPECLAWSDEQVATVERWLAEGGEVPEVLRAG